METKTIVEQLNKYLEKNRGSLSISDYQLLCDVKQKLSIIEKNKFSLSEPKNLQMMADIILQLLKFFEIIKDMM